MSPHRDQSSNMVVQWKTRMEQRIHQTGNHNVEEKSYWKTWRIDLETLPIIWLASLTPLEWTLHGATDWLVWQCVQNEIWLVVHRQDQIGWKAWVVCSLPEWWSKGPISSLVQRSLNWPDGAKRKWTCLLSSLIILLFCKISPLIAMLIAFIRTIQSECAHLLLQLMRFSCAFILCCMKPNLPGVLKRTHILYLSLCFYKSSQMIKCSYFSNQFSKPECDCISNAHFLLIFDLTNFEIIILFSFYAGNLFNINQLELSSLLYKNKL